MLKLGTVLDTWRPKPSPGGDPLVAARCVWPELVGPDVARAAQPVAIERDTLIVLTTSASWSHQLAFLEPEIARGLRALPETAGVTKVRFRVGKLRRSGAAATTAAAARRLPRAAVAVEPPATTLEDALARLRRSVERSRAAHRAQGGVFCARCEAPIAGGPHCVPCRDEVLRAQRFACERLLFEAPWLSSSDVLALVDGLTPDAYDAIRRRLLKSWWDEIWRAGKLFRLKQPIDRIRLRKLASSFVLLETRIDPNRLEMDSAVRRNALGDCYDFVHEIETGLASERVKG